MKPLAYIAVDAHLRFLLDYAKMNYSALCVISVCFYSLQKIAMSVESGNLLMQNYICVHDLFVNKFIQYGRFHSQIDGSKLYLLNTNGASVDSYECRCVLYVDP